MVTGDLRQHERADNRLPEPNGVLATASRRDAADRPDCQRGARGYAARGKSAGKGFRLRGGQRGRGAHSHAGDNAYMPRLAARPDLAAPPPPKPARLIRMSGRTANVDQ